MRARLATTALIPLGLLFGACSSPSSHLAEAEQQYAATEYYQAFHAIEQAREAYPDDEEIEAAYWKIRLPYLLKQGQELVFANREEEALAYFEKALVLDPGNEIALSWMRKADDKMATRAAYEADWLRKRGELKQALVKYHEALQHQPGNPEAEAGLRMLGDIWRKMQDQAQYHYLEGVRALSDELFSQTRYHLLIAIDKDPSLEQAEQPRRRAERYLMEERFAEAQRMTEEGYYGPALREYQIIRQHVPAYPGLAEKIAAAETEAQAQRLAEKGELAVFRGEFGVARQLLQEAYDMTSLQRDDIGERLMLVHERQVESRYSDAKDQELQGRLEKALAAYRDIDQELPDFEDVRTRMEDLELRIEEALKAFHLGAEAESRGDAEQAIEFFNDVQLYWPAYSDSLERLARLRSEAAAGDI